MPGHPVARSNAPEDTSADMPPLRAGIQSVEVGYTLLAALAAAPGPLMWRDLAAAAGMNAAKAHRYLVSFQRLALESQDLVSFDGAWDGPVAVPRVAAARQLSGDLGFRGA